MARLLVELGAEKDLTNFAGRTALAIAVGVGHVAGARLLVDAGADQDVFDNYGTARMHTASAYKHIL